MEFIVFKTSQGYSSEEKPVEAAYKKMWPFYQIRTVTEEEFNARFSSSEGLWRSKGTDHQSYKSKWIKRRIEDREYWTIEIKSLEELISFQRSYGPIIIGKHDSLAAEEIEIYDDYRE